MKLCSRPGCHTWTDSEVELCTYDQKIRDGLITPDHLVYGRRWSQPRVRRKVGTVNPSDVVTDEQLEVAALMRAYGASESVIARAMAKWAEAEKMPVGAGAKATGVKRGRLVAP